MTASHGGKRSGAGRKRGVRNAETVERQATIAELAKQHTETAILALVSVMTSSESDAARVSAANAILDRGHGRPVQALDHSFNNRPAEEMTDDELAAIAAGSGGGASEPEA